VWRCFVGFSRIASLVPIALLTVGLPTATADPITVTSGYIQVGTDATDFLISTTGPGFAGERETGVISPVLFSGLSGETVNLSTTFNYELSNASLLTPDRNDFAARVAFSFTAGGVTLPPVEAALGDGTWLSTTFGFQGTIFGYESRDAMLSGAAPVSTYDLIGSGTARARFGVQQNNMGEPLFNQPLATHSVVFEFVQTPEPGSWVLVGSGLAVAGWRFRRSRRKP